VIEHVRPHRWGSLAAERFGRIDRVASDAQGRFRLGGLEPGSACLKITPPGAAPMAIQVEALAEGESRQLGTLPVRVEAAQTVRIELPPATAYPTQLDLGAAAAGRYALLLTEEGASVGALVHQLGYSLTVSPEGLLDLPPLASGRWLLRWLGGPIGSERAFRVKAGRPVIPLRLPG
jgi:hypothetical protein